jgi:hypothetical protein
MAVSTRTAMMDSLMTRLPHVWIGYCISIEGDNRTQGHKPGLGSLSSFDEPGTRVMIVLKTRRQSASVAMREVSHSYAFS